MPSSLPPSRPVLLSIAGADPSSGAGLQADLLTGTALGLHVCTVLSAWTVQDSRGVRRVQALAAADVGAQIETLWADFAIAAVKIGLLGSLATAQVVWELLAARPELPVVLDPLWRSGAGEELASAELLAFLRERLLPRAQIATPNLPEACHISGADSADAAARDWPSEWLLISGGHGPGQFIDNRLYQRGRLVEQFLQPRREGEFHGTGCTLSTAIAAGLALGQEMPAAVAAALNFTHAAVQAAYAPGRGQYFLDRRQARP